jgi:hypothetical protein
MERLRKEAKADCVKRIVSSLSLDGKRLTAEINVEFVRELGTNTAEAIGDQVFSIVDGILSELIVQNQIPISSTELEERTMARLGSTSSKIDTIRVTRVRLAEPRSQPAFRSQMPAQHRLTPPPGSSGSAPPPASPESGHSSGHGRAVSNRTPPARQSSGPAPASHQRMAVPSSARAPQPAISESMVPSVKSRQSNRPPSHPAPSRRGPPDLPTLPVRAAARTSPNGPPPLPGSAASARSEQTRADRDVAKETASSAGESGSDFAAQSERAAAAQGRLVRDAAAYALVAALANATGGIDKFAIFEGKGQSKLLRQEASACFAGAVYTASRKAGTDHKEAVACVNAACRSARFVEAPTPADISRYISSQNPSEELASRMAELLGGENEPAVFASSIAACHKTVSARLYDLLARARAHG